jgi:hypothetical protein
MEMKFATLMISLFLVLGMGLVSFTLKKRPPSPRTINIPFDQFKEREKGNQ